VSLLLTKLKCYLLRAFGALITSSRAWLRKDIGRDTGGSEIATGDVIKSVHLV